MNVTSCPLFPRFAFQSADACYPALGQTPRQPWKQLLPLHPGDIGKHVTDIIEEGPLYLYINVDTPDSGLDLAAWASALMMEVKEHVHPGDTRALRRMKCTPALCFYFINTEGNIPQPLVMVVYSLSPGLFEF